MKTIYIKEEIEELILTHKAIRGIKNYSVDVLDFTELKLVESILNNTILYKDATIKRLNKGIVCKDSYTSNIVEYDYIRNKLEFYTIKGVYLKYIDIDKFLSKLDERIKLENLGE